VLSRRRGAEMPDDRAVGTAMLTSSTASPTELDGDTGRLSTARHRGVPSRRPGGGQGARHRGAGRRRLRLPLRRNSVSGVGRISRAALGEPSEDQVLDYARTSRPPRMKASPMARARQQRGHLQPRLGDGREHSGQQLKRQPGDQSGGQRAHPDGDETASQTGRRRAVGQGSVFSRTSRNAPPRRPRTAAARRAELITHDLEAKRLGRGRSTGSR